MDLVNTQLAATQQQLQALTEKYNTLTFNQSVLLQELISVQKTASNHEHVLQYVMNHLNSVEHQRRRESRVLNPFGPTVSHEVPNGTATPGAERNPLNGDEDVAASPLQHASKLLSETNADNMLNTRNLEQMNEQQIRLNAALTTPPHDPALRNGARSSSRGAQPHSATSSTSVSYGELDNMVYPIGHTQGIDPMYSEHISNIPYALPTQPADGGKGVPPQDGGRKKSTQIDPGWLRQPQILLVEDDQTCRRIGGKFLVAFQCAIDCAVSIAHQM